MVALRGFHFRSRREQTQISKTFCVIESRDHTLLTSVLPKSFSGVKVGRAVLCAPPNVVKTMKTRTLCIGRGAHGVRSLPMSHSGNTP
jgi:hypothetical protein